MAESTASAAERRPSRVTQEGVGTSVAGLQSVVVQVERRVLHPRYHKYLSRRSTLMAHDERNECAVGDRVEIVSSRPMSARKRWRVRKVVVKVSIPGTEAEA